MTRKVFNNAMCAHVWAQQDQDSGRSHNGNSSFEGATFYSYQTPIARFVETNTGGRAVLVTTKTYSNTTSGKHMPAVNRALGYGDTTPGGDAIFHVPHVGNRGYYGVGVASPLSAEMHADNLAYLAKRYDDYAGRVQRQREAYMTVDSLAAELTRCDIAAERYARLFGLTYETRDVHADAAAVFVARAEREAKNNTPAAIARREKAAKARIAKKEREEELAAATAIERLAAWRAGELSRLDRYSDLKLDSSGGAFLRVRGGNLETSQGATVPLDHAVKVFRFVKLCRENAQEWRRNGRTLRVGHFQVDSVDASGNFRAGCHLINWPEVETAARAAGVIDEAAADTREGEVQHA